MKTVNLLKILCVSATFFACAMITKAGVNDVIEIRAGSAGGRFGEKETPLLKRYRQEQAFLRRKVEVGVTDLGLLDQLNDLTVTRQQATVSTYYPKESTIKNIMEKHWSDLAPFDVKKIEEGGTFTGTLFAVARSKNPTRNVFFVKVSNVGSLRAAENLKEVQESVVGRLKSLALKTGKKYSDLPTIVNVERLFKYRVRDKEMIDKSGKISILDYTIEVTHAALGDSVHDILMERVLTNFSPERIGHEVGKALGTFHFVTKKEMKGDNPEKWKTITHHDLHPQNVFIRTQDFVRVYFIDNETMAQSIRSGGDSIEYDLERVIFHPTLYWQETVQSRWKNYRQFFNGFLHGYVGAYPSSVQNSLALFLKEEFIKKRIEILKKELQKQQPDSILLGIYGMSIPQDQIFIKEQLNDLEQIANNLDVLIDSAAYQSKLSQLSTAQSLKAIRMAVINNDIDAVREHIKKGFDVNAPKQSYLSNAASFDYTAILQALLGMDGVDVNLDSPLHSAAVEVHLDVIKMLVQAGTDPLLLNDSHNTALHEAASPSYVDEEDTTEYAKSRLEIMRFFKDKGYDINVLNSEGKTPLDLAKEDENDTYSSKVLQDYIDGLVKLGAKTSEELKQQ